MQYYKLYENETICFYPIKLNMKLSRKMLWVNKITIIWQVLFFKLKKRQIKISAI